eukprot:TRINITY_DN1122_c0_g2_i1.p1 TRINITY_DN1122_c0_g2~~TRINITY_DN1122_c0_g2_i1.p1  ORF type:complete len:762 (+),score=197.59 TRINITY_DN1122_c0_g2_i1:344-2287(+)
MDQVIYTHRNDSDLLVMTISGNLSVGAEPLPVYFHNPQLNFTTPDIDFVEVQGPSNDTRCWNGSIVTTETPWSPHVIVAMCTTSLNTAGLKFMPGVTNFTLYASFATSAQTDFDASVTKKQQEQQQQQQQKQKLQQLQQQQHEPSRDDRYPVHVNAGRGALELQTASDNLMKHLDTPYEDIWLSHVGAWAALWAEGRIEVVGDRQLSQTLNSTMYYLLSAIREDWNFGISPGGIANMAYHGHVFWDQETWMYPTFLLLHQGLAKSMLQYRVDRMPTAKMNALDNGNVGCKFPWESAYTGIECTGVGNIEGTYEIHINGDISLAVQQYWLATGDEVWLNSTGFPLLQCVSTYWASRVSVRNESSSSDRADSSSMFQILNVMPPDESAGVVNNSAYTNAICAHTLNTTINFASLLRRSAEVGDNWTKIAQNMYMPFNDTLQIYEEYDGFSNHPHTINQADVALLTYPLNMDLPYDVAKNDLVYYQNLTDDDGYFTGDSSYTIAWLQLNGTAQADASFANVFLHMTHTFNVWKEKITGGHINFLTGGGGYLQEIIYGYAGVSLLRVPNSLYLNPSLPPGNATQVNIVGMAYQGRSIDVSITAMSTSITLTDGAPLLLRTNNQTVQLAGTVEVFNQPIVLSVVGGKGSGMV